MKILIAEDDATTRCMLGGLLSKWNYDVIATCDGNEAWKILEGDNPPPLVILDWVMPGMDGIELCHQIRNAPQIKMTYIILLTSLWDTEDIVLGLGAGANDYIKKPFEKNELRARIQVGERVIQLQQELAIRITELEEAMAHIKTLQGMLPICMYCHKIRTDQESWERIEQYIEQHSDAEFSHGICPECLAKYHPELEAKDESQN